jgi:SAM-dependent methyltransferase
MESLSETGALGRTMARIRQLEPTYGAKLDAYLARMDGEFFNRAERSLAQFELFLLGRDRTLDYGIDCHLKLRGQMLEERMEFRRSGRYASTSFAEVEKRVYADPAIMEYYMYGLVFSQFFWQEQYARLEFFCRGLPAYRDRIGSHLELGGGHGIYLACATEMLAPGTHFELIDISPVSMNLARVMNPSDQIQYHLCNVFDYPEGRKFDFIVAGEILEHLEEPRRLLAKIRDLLTPQGRAFISTPVNAPTVDHIYLFRNTQEIRDMLASEGFTIESEATRYAEELPEVRCQKLKVAQMFASFVRVTGS